MGQIDPLIEQQFIAEAGRMRERDALLRQEIDNTPEVIRQEIEQTLVYYFGMVKNHAHPSFKTMFPQCNRKASDHLNEDFFQFYNELSNARQDRRALGSENAASGGYVQIVSAPYNPHPIPDSNMKAYERIGFLYQKNKLIAFAHFFDLGDGIGPLSRDDKDLLDKGAVFLDNKVSVIAPQEGSEPMVGVFGTSSQLRDFLETHLYEELEQLAVTAHQETTPLNPEYRSRSDKAKDGAKSIGRLPVVATLSAIGKREKAIRFANGQGLR